MQEDLEPIVPLSDEVPTTVVSPAPLPAGTMDDGTNPFIGRFGLRAGWGIALFFLIFSILSFAFVVATRAAEGKSLMPKSSKSASSQSKPPVQVGEAVLVDGAAINNLPVDIMQAHAPGLVIGEVGSLEQAEDVELAFEVEQDVDAVHRIDAQFFEGTVGLDLLEGNSLGGGNHSKNSCLDRLRHWGPSKNHSSARAHC